MRRWQGFWRSGLALLSLLALTACEHHHHHVAYTEPAERVYVEPPAVTYYEYYPDVEVYFEPQRHFYWWFEGGIWRSGPVVPPGIRLGAHVRLNSPEPWRHHNEIIRRYPHHWRGRGEHEEHERRY